ncbi:hypothetical protein BZG36_01512 [Bifiguratus adelaidae]|uniref:non-specific serine/threonine protein kinase n=1 Tax=Bifiguratus adelaidae TaxID=1938954 RepID=A0A261Y4X1_9FUNG|nr:hypothetical protein BZG36_01512 [Bifiguratus adelaidae]
MATLQLKDIDLSLPYSRDGSMAGPVPFSAPPIRRSKQTEQPRSQEEGRKALVNTSKKASFRKSEPTTMTKYDQLRQAQQASNQQAAKQFIQRVLGRDALDDHVGFFEGLRDGIVLCRLVNAIQPNLIPTIGYKDLPFVKMENIANFLQGARALGLANSDLFQTVDLYEGKDLAVVVATLLTLERLVYGVPSPQLATHPPVVDSSSAAIDENASRPEENSVSSTDADRTRHSVSSLVLQSHPRSSLREAEDDDQLQDYIGGLGISTPKSPTFPSSPLPQRDVYSRSASALKAIESPSLPSRPIRSYLIATPPSPSLRTPSTSERTHRPNYGRSSSYDSQDTPNTLYTKARSDRYQEPSNMFSDVDTSGRLYPSGILSPGQSSLRRNSIPEEVNQHNSLPRDPLAASRSNLQKIKTFGRASVITANAASEGKQRRCNDGPPRPRTYLPLQSGRSFGNANTHEVTKPPISVATRPSPINNTKSTDAPNEGPLPQYQHVRDIYAQMDKELEERRLQRQNNGRTTSDLEERAGTWNTPSSASNRSSIRSNRLLGKATALQDLLRDSQDDSSAVQKENGRASLLDWASRPESDGENDDKSCAPVLVNRVQTSEDDAGKIDRKSATEDESIARSSISSIPTSIPSIPDSDEEEAGMAQSASLWTTLNHPSSNSRDSRQSSSGVFRKANDSGYGTSQRKPTQEIRVRLEEIEQSFKELGSADPSLRSPSWCLLDGSVDSLRSNTGLSTLASSDRTISVMNIPKSFGSISSRRNSIQEPYNTSMAPSNSQLKRLAISEAEKRSQASKSFLSISSGQSSIGKEDASKREILSLADDDDELIQYQLGNCIGKGQFGAVYRALNLNNGQMVAVKRIKKEDGLEEEMDNLMNGSLLHTLKSFGAFPEKLIASYVMRILDGLEYLHEEGVVHCDLKAANILTTKSGNVKLSDFGVSLNLKLREADTGVVAGTPNWKVIELKGASTKSDIWSLGCTVIELFTGKPPYSNLIAMTTLFRIVEDERPPIPEKCSTDMRDFLIECFQKDPDQRPDAVDLKRHPWLVRHAAQKVLLVKPVKKHAMFCEDCNLICHDKCKVHARECSANLTTAFTDNELLTTSVTHSPLLSQNTQQSPSTQSRSRSYSYVEPKVVTPPSPNPSVSSNMKDRARKISRVFSSVSPSSIQQHVMEGLKHRSPFHMENPSTTGSYDDRNSYFTPNNAPATPSNRHARSSRSLSINLGDHTSPRRSLAGTPSPFRPPTIDEDYFDTNVQKGKGNKEEDCAIS